LGAAPVNKTAQQNHHSQIKQDAQARAGNEKAAKSRGKRRGY